MLQKAAQIIFSLTLAIKKETSTLKKKTQIKTTAT